MFSKINILAILSLSVNKVGDERHNISEVSSQVHIPTTAAVLFPSQPNIHDWFPVIFIIVAIRVVGFNPYCLL